MKPNTELLRSIVDGFPNDSKWHFDYMHFNWVRIFEDFQFIRSQISTSSRILDIGAVPPLLAALLKGAGYSDITIADPNASAFQSYFNKNAIKYIDVDVLNRESNPLTGCYDLVCLNEVIEHLSGNLLEVLDRVTSCVAPNGLLLVTTPNLRSLSGLYALTVCNSGLASKPFETVRKQYERSTAKYGYFGHLREFTPKEVVDLISSFGFVPQGARFQANYLRQSIPHRLLSVLELVTPRYRLFGKYLFRRAS